MNKTTSPGSRKTEKPLSSRRIKNAFAPYCRNEHFTPATLTGLCRYGFPYDELPEEGRQMVDEYMKEYSKRCSNGDGSWKPKPIPKACGQIRTARPHPEPRRS